MNEYKNWHKLVLRRTAVLPAEIITLGYLNAPYKQVLDIDCSFSAVTYINFGAYLKKEEFFNFVTKAHERVKQDIGYVEWVIKRTYEQCDKLLKAVEVDISNLQERNNKELADILRKYVDECHNMGPFWLVPFAIEKIATEMVLGELEKKTEGDQSKAKDYLSILATPHKKVDVKKEEQEFLKLAIEISKLGYRIGEGGLKESLKENKDLWDKISLHVYKYEWLDMLYMEGKIRTIEDFFLRIRNLSNPEEKLKSFPKREEEIKEKAKKVTEELKLSEETIKLIKGVREYVYLRTYKRDVTTIVDYKMRGLIKEIARRMNFSYEEAIYLLSEEIYEFLESGKTVSQAVIEDRMKEFAFLVEGKTIKMLTGKGLEDYKKVWGAEDLGEDIKEFKGDIANRGYGRGRARIILNKNLISTFQQDEVLVASMTTPDFVPIMKKAAAIITDEGGITCHAALLSRELKIPCIVSTNIATKVLKDRDLVEVDAEKGIVKILERAK